MANVVLVDLYGVDKIARTKGRFNVFNAVAGFLATPSTGFAFDVTGNYDLPFVIVGSMSIAGSVMALMVYFISKRRTVEHTETPAV